MVDSGYSHHILVHSATYSASCDTMAFLASFCNFDTHHIHKLRIYSIELGGGGGMCTKDGTWAAYELAISPCAHAQSSSSDLMDINVDIVNNLSRVLSKV